MPDSFRAAWLRRERLVALGLTTTLLAGVTVVVFGEHLFSGWTFPYDFLGPYSTTPAFVGATIGQGHQVSWMPFVASGFPVAVDPQAGLYFPLWWMLGALGVPLTLSALTAVQVGHVLFGALGVLALARARRLPWPWAALAALAYVFFGGFYGDAEHADYVRGFSYAPWLLWALTPPSGHRRWRGLVALPPLTWLIATGAYPGQIVAFALVGIAYLAIELRARGHQLSWRKRVGPLLLAAGACAAVTLAVLLPFIAASMRGDLHRALEPTPAVRASFSIHALDVLGLYLNNFAWTYEGTITAWAVGIPTLIGLGCLGRRGLSRHAALAVAGGVALLLAVAPAVGPIGQLMADVRPLFPTRFPAADYKAFVAVALVVLGAEGWRAIAEHVAGAESGPRVAWGALGVAAGIVAGALLAPATHAQPTRTPALVAAIVIATVGLALWRPRPTVLAGALLALVVVDGAREISDYRQASGVQPWRISPGSAAWARARDPYVRRLALTLSRPPPVRPARLPPNAPLARFVTGTEPDASGWVGDGYRLTDYGSTIERVRWQAEHDPTWSALLLAPWHGWTFSCASVGCADGRVRLPAPSGWSPDPRVRTTSYGPQRIVYEVALPHAALMVENELAIRGWHADRPGVRTVDAGIPLRTWRLPAGRYRFSASYQQPDQTGQLVATVVALVAWAACAGLLWFGVRERVGAKPDRPADPLPQPGGRA